MKLTSSADLQRISSIGFQKTDNFRLYRLTSRDLGRNRQIGSVKAVDTTVSTTGAAHSRHVDDPIIDYFILTTKS